MTFLDYCPPPSDENKTCKVLKQWLAIKLQKKQTNPKNNSKGHDNVSQEFVYDVAVKTVKSKSISDSRSGLHL